MYWWLNVRAESNPLDSRCKKCTRMGHLGRALLLVLGAGLVASLVPSPRAYPGHKIQSALTCVCGTGRLPFEVCCGSETPVTTQKPSDLLSCPCGSGLPVELCCGGLAPRNTLQHKAQVTSTCPCGSGIPYEDCCGEPLFRGHKEMVLS